MTHCLVTFLGRTARENGDGAYRQVDYHFEDNTTQRAAFLGFPLHHWLGADRLVVFGTAGSMWDHLFEGDIELGGEDDARVELITATEEKRVTQALLDQLTPLLARALNCEVRLRIIPRALEAPEQTALVQALADAAKGADRLSLDVTHGYRHLPMLAFTAALYLRFIRPTLSIEGLWYGELDHEVARAQVHNLGGLLKTADWLSALQRHDWLGDYQGIAEQIADDDPNLANDLRQASFLESIHQGRQARSNIRNARARLNGRPLQGIGALFEEQLNQRMAWVDGQSMHVRQSRHARDALGRRDYVRASLYGFEAFITRITQERFPNAEPDVYETRKEAENDFRSAHPPANVVRYYKLLQGVRNVLAHGHKARHPDVERAIRSEASLLEVLEKSFAVLLPEE